jgi:hypothetical protein
MPVIDVERFVLEANFVVWMEARATLEAMPQSTFLPANAWARLAVELPDQAADAAAWLALNDAVDACDEAVEDLAVPAIDPDAVAGRMARLASRLNVVLVAAEATMTILPTSASQSLEEVLTTVEPALYRARSAAARQTLGPLRAYVERLRQMHGLRSAVPVLPTLDQTPLDQVAL